jgi:hypothetical protein
MVVDRLPAIEYVQRGDAPAERFVLPDDLGNQFLAIDCVPLFLGRRVVHFHIRVTPS